MGKAETAPVKTFLALRITGRDLGGLSGFTRSS